MNIFYAFKNYEADYNNYTFTYYIIQETREYDKSTLRNCIKIERMNIMQISRIY